MTNLLEQINFLGVTTLETSLINTKSADIESIYVRGANVRDTFSTQSDYVKDAFVKDVCTKNICIGDVSIITYSRMDSQFF